MLQKKQGYFQLLILIQAVISTEADSYKIQVLKRSYAAVVKIFALDDFSEVQDNLIVFSLSVLCYKQIYANQICIVLNEVKIP